MKIGIWEYALLGNTTRRNSMRYTTYAKPKETSAEIFNDISVQESFSVVFVFELYFLKSVNSCKTLLNSLLCTWNHVNLRFCTMLILLTFWDRYHIMKSIFWVLIIQVIHKKANKLFMFELMNWLCCSMRHWIMSTSKNNVNTL